MNELTHISDLEILERAMAGTQLLIESLGTKGYTIERNHLQLQKQELVLEYARLLKEREVYNADKNHRDKRNRICHI